MPKSDPRIDAYIEKAPPFARPILKHLRKVVHKGCPDVIEGIKWGAPHFSYKGIFCGMAAFKQHCIFGFWKHQLLVERGIVKPGGVALGYSDRITSLKDLPKKRELIRVVKAAAELNDQGIKLERPKGAPKPPVRVPEYFIKALKKHKKAEATFKAFSPSHRREYVMWITDAKTEDTRERRIAQAIMWMAEGKPRNWKYMR